MLPSGLKTPRKSFKPKVFLSDMVLKPIETPHSKQQVLDLLELKEDLTSKNICMIVPTLGNKEIEKMNEQELINILFRSFVSSLTPFDLKNFFFSFYIGFDKDDPVFDDPTNLKTLEGIINKLEARIPLSVKMIRVSDSEIIKSPARIWSGLANMGYWEGCDYFYQANDDLKIITRNWTLPFVQALQNSPVFPNLGIVFPTDLSYPDIATQSFVHRTHLDLFGSFYPFSYKNWFSDNWIQLTYSAIGADFRMNSFQVDNKKRTPRYSADHTNFADLNTDLRRSCERIADFLSIHNPSQLSSFKTKEELQHLSQFALDRISALEDLIKESEVIQKKKKGNQEKDLFPCVQVEMDFWEWGKGTKMVHRHHLLGDLEEDLIEKERSFAFRFFGLWPSKRSVIMKVSPKVNSILRSSEFVKNQAQNSLKKTIIITFTNWNQIKTTEEWARRMKEIKQDNFLVVSLDKQSFDHLESKDINTFFHKSFEDQEQHDKRAGVILGILFFQNSVLFVENDVLVSKDVLDFIDHNQHSMISWGDLADSLSEFQALFVRESSQAIKFFVDLDLVSTLTSTDFQTASDHLFRKAFHRIINIESLPFKDSFSKITV